MNTVAIFQSYLSTKSWKVLCRICNFPWEKCIKWNHDNFPELELLCKSNKDLIREINIQLQQNVLSFDAFQRAKKQAKKPSIIFTEREKEFQIHSLPLLGKTSLPLIQKSLSLHLKISLICIEVDRVAFISEITMKFQERDQLHAECRD